MNIKKSLTISSLNTRGATSNILYIDQLCKSSDIVCLQEHHLFPYNASMLSTISTEYRTFLRCQSFIRNDGVPIRQGGLAIMWKAGINHTITKLHDVGNENIMGVHINHEDGNSIYLFNVYLPATNHSFEEYLMCANAMSNIYDYYQNLGSVIFVGDLNISLNTGNRSLPNVNDKRRSRFLNLFWMIMIWLVF